MLILSRDVFTSPVPPTLPELEAIAAGDEDSCTGLINRWEVPIRCIASAHAARTSDVDDLIQVGRISLYRAALKFNPLADVPFANYAKRVIKHAILKEAARIARQRAFETSLDGISDDGEANQTGLVDRNSQADLVRRWCQELGEPHATIYRLLYSEGVRQRRAAEELGVSQPRIAQLHKSFLNLARAAFAG
jgi:RNA polymerase sigma factor (sigma-70 family)